MRRRIHLHGAFAGYHEGPIEIVADTVWDAVEAVTRQVKGFRPDPKTGRKILQVVGFSTIESLKQRSDVEDIHIMPALNFGKKAGIVQTIIGVSLIAVGVLMGGTFWPALVISAGISMTIGGVMQMLMKQPTIGTTNAEDQRSKYLPGTGNTVKLGTTIGLGYGRYRCGGHILSLNIDSKDVGI